MKPPKQVYWHQRRLHILFRSVSYGGVPDRDSEVVTVANKKGRGLPRIDELPVVVDLGEHGRPIGAVLLAREVATCTRCSSLPVGAMRRRVPAASGIELPPLSPTWLWPTSLCR